MPVQTKIQHRRDTAANWTSTNPTLASGEIGFETDTGKFKIGNGSTAWTSLAYQNYAGPTIGTTSITSGGTFTALPGVTSINGSTIPASDTLVGRATTDTLTNKTLTSPTINGATVTGTVTSTATLAPATTSTPANSFGYLGVPVNSVSTPYTLQASDAGKLIYMPSYTSITIPANSSVAFPIGTSITFIAVGSDVSSPTPAAQITITNDNLILAGNGLTGTRNIVINGLVL